MYSSLALLNLFLGLANMTLFALNGQAFNLVAGLANLFVAIFMVWAAE